jgi:hypothetical protein
MHRLTRRELLTASGAGIASVAGWSAAWSAPRVAKPAYDAYKLIVLAAKPAGYWRLGDKELATAVDESPGRNDGKYVGRPRFEPQGAIRGDTNGAVVLDGQSYVEIPSDRAFSQPTSGAGLSVEVWLRPDKLDFADNSAGKYIHWLGKGEENQHEWALRFYTKGDAQRSNRISAYHWNADGGLGAGAYFQDPLVPGQWLHVVACFEPLDANPTGRPAGVQIYKNGVGRQGPPAKGTLYRNPQWKVVPTAGTAPVRLGTRDRKEFLIGALDEVAIYPRVLTPEEIRLHYEIGSGIRKLSSTELAKLRRLVQPSK